MNWSVGITEFVIVSDGRCTFGAGPAKELQVQSWLRLIWLWEHAPLVWIWMGNSNLAGGGLRRPLSIGCQQLPDWASSRNYLKMACSYVLLHENLIDLSHLTFFA